MQKNSPYNIIKRTSIVNACTNLTLSILKILMGWFGNAHALVADGLHSLSDLLSDLLVFFAGKAGNREPNAHHPYGYKRIETIAAIVIALIFSSTGVALIYQAAVQSFLLAPNQKPTLWAVVTGVSALLANIALFYYTRLKSKTTSSTLLLAYAEHNRSDAYVALLVLCTLIASSLGWKHFDLVGTLAVSILMIKSGIKLIIKNINELMDGAVDPQKNKTIHNIIENTPGVLALHQLRTRSHGGHILVDVHILVNPKISISEGHFISEKVRSHLLQGLPSVTDVTVHIDPEDDELIKDSTLLPARETIEKILLQEWQTFPCVTAIETIQLHYLGGQLDIDIYFPIRLLDTHSAHTLQNFYNQPITALPRIHTVHLHFIQ